MNRKKQFISGKFSVLSIILLVLSIGLASTAYSQSNKSDGMDDALKEKSVPKRDPFWPVGYVPEGEVKVDDEQKIVIPVVNNNWNEAMKNVVINGVSSRADHEFFAVINGQVKSVGERVTLKHEGTVYTWAVERITPPGSVKLRRVSAQ